jgi:hypothetical protein
LLLSGRALLLLLLLLVGETTRETGSLNEGALPLRGRVKGKSEKFRGWTVREAEPSMNSAADAMSFQRSAKEKKMGKKIIQKTQVNTDGKGGCF